MNVSHRPRHWIALIIALFTMVLGIIAFADFSGEPSPRWRQTLLMLGSILTAATVSINLALDKRG